MLVRRASVVGIKLCTCFAASPDRPCSCLWGQGDTVSFFVDVLMTCILDRSSPIDRISDGWLIRRKAISVTWAADPSTAARSTNHRIGDVLEHAVNFLTLRSGADDFSTLLCTGFFEDRQRRDTTMLPRRRSIFRIWKGCFRPISGPGVAHGADVEVRSREPVGKKTATKQKVRLQRARHSKPPTFTAANSIAHPTLFVSNKPFLQSRPTASFERASNIHSRE